MYEDLVSLYAIVEHVIYFKYECHLILLIYRNNEYILMIHLKI